MDKDKDPRNVRKSDWLVIVPALVMAFVIFFLSTLYPSTEWPRVKNLISWITFVGLVFLVIIAYVRKGTDD